MITLNNLNFSYTPARPVLRGLNVEIPEGSIVGLLGKNGVGKTTLLHLISGLLKPTSPEQISVFGRVPFKKEVSFLSRIFIVPEEFSLPRITIMDYAKLYSKFYPKFSYDTFNSVLREFEVDPTIKTNKMSFGQRKKAYIAFALATGTELLLLDEPTNGLDITSKQVFRRALCNYAAEDCTVIISTHQVRDLDEILDRVVILENNKVLLNATVGEITEKLRFEALAPDANGVLFWQSTIAGAVGVRRREEGEEETTLDIEMLFGAVTESPVQIDRIFNETNH